MADSRFIQKLRIRNLLSFGPESEEIELGPLNVLIGPNGSGKSNFVACVRLLRAAPDDLRTPIIEGGGLAEWLWKGSGAGSTSSIDVEVRGPQHGEVTSHGLALESFEGRPRIAAETIGPPDFRDHAYKNSPDTAFVTTAKPEDDHDVVGIIYKHNMRQDQSILSQLRDPDRYPLITYLAQQYASIAMYESLNVARGSALRTPQLTDAPDDFLREDAANLSLVLRSLRHLTGVWEGLLPRLQQFAPEIEDVFTRMYDDRVALLAYEQGLSSPVSASRMSDGTLRYLCLLAILCHPEPPPLVCIEEPELGLHPDILPTVAKLLIEASQRTQLIVTTHSDLLVSALSEVPDSVIVCERYSDGSHLRPLDGHRLQKWLKDYSLGDLWLMGELGGTL